MTMDFGAVCGGYLADMTRTVAVGSVTDEQKAVYEIVREAQKRAFDRIRPAQSAGTWMRRPGITYMKRGIKAAFPTGSGTVWAWRFMKIPALRRVQRTGLRQERL